MARGTQLLKLVEMLREELLYDEYDWPFLRQMFPAKTLQAGERYFDFPVGLNSNRIDDNDGTEGPGVVCWYSNMPMPLQRGIGFNEYAIYNSDNGVRQEPAIKWDIRWTGTSEQIEIWPIPVTNTSSIQLKGIRKLRPLIADGDVCDLDDQLIVLFTAAELLSRAGAANASAVGAAAKARLARMKGRAKSGSSTYRLGMGTGGTDSRFPIVVHARSN